jgi:hypothetical protein
MSKKITEHVTGKAEILFMAAAKALHNKRTGKSEFSIKVKLSSDDAAVTHLKEIANYKIDTKTNRALEGTNTTVVNFASDFAPEVVDMSNESLQGSEIPYFDGRKDTGTAFVSYKVIDYGDNKIVRLSGIKLNELNLVPRDEQSTSLNVTLDTLKNIG